ncbi:hypothetical protein V8G54_019566 [Vigna mungo]|uniref:ribose-5-phosphate isomerase n=1 Tax=Vigna mungo TaxID=3915 RepID=A0AAQ3NC14_VIGMU
MEEGKGRVCVTGGSGFVGSWIVKRLLEDGYTVNTTVRPDPDAKGDLSFLTNLPGASEKLRIFSADLSDPESFNEAIEGCFGVLHTATPFDVELNEAEEVVTQRSIDGALGILKACLNSKTVKRVVYTSSASAVYRQEKEDDVMDESYWSDENLLRDLKPFAWAYSISKTLTEKAVLEFGEKHGLDVVTLIPTFVLGPFICPRLPSSVYVTLSFLFDVEQIADLLSAKYPNFQISVDEVKKFHDVKLPHLISKKLMDAGFEFKYSMEEMFVDAIECCKQNVVTWRNADILLSSSSRSPSIVFTQYGLKKIAAYKTVEYVESGMVFGLGTGSTAKHAVNRIGELLRQGKVKEIIGIPTSKITHEEALSLGIPLSDLDSHPVVDLAIDGVDEVDPFLFLNLV